MTSNISRELESKRIENAETRKLVFVLLGTTAVVWVLLILNRIHRNTAPRWTLLAAMLPAGYCLYRLAQKAKKIKSVLPPDMESKRVRIGKVHNQLCLALLLVTGVLPIGAIWVRAVVIDHYAQAIFWVALLMAALTEGFGFYRIVQYDNALCRQLGYVCPICHEPLYEAHATTYLSGLCPKCKKSVIS